MAVYRPKYRDPKTGKLKQSRVWWFNFTFAGKRIQESAKTTRKTLAVEAEKRRRAELERALAGLPAEKPTHRIRTVAEALKAYQKGYGVNHREKSVMAVKNCSAHLERLLGSVLLPDLTQDRVLDYMGKRQGEGASNRTINMELSVLSCAIGQTWKALWPKVKRLEQNSEAGRALESEEEKALLDAAAGNRSRLIYPYLMTLTWTGMRSDEARMLRCFQADFGAGQIVVGKSKSEAGRG